MTKPRLATCSLTGCFGCHMSLLDIDERILELVDLVDLDVSPLDDKKTFDRPVDVGLVEGGCCNEYNVKELKEFRQHCRDPGRPSAPARSTAACRPCATPRCCGCLEAVYLNDPALEGAA